MDERNCNWALYKGLWHKECNSFLTTTQHGDMNYTSDEIPLDRVCPDCGREIVIVDRRFGRCAGGGRLSA